MKDLYLKYLDAQAAVKSAQAAKDVAGDAYLACLSGRKIHAERHGSAWLVTITWGNGDFSEGMVRWKFAVSESGWRMHPHFESELRAIPLLGVPGLWEEIKMALNLAKLSHKIHVRPHSALGSYTVTVDFGRTIIFDTCTRACGVWMGVSRLTEEALEFLGTSGDREQLGKQLRTEILTALDAAHKASRDVRGRPGDDPQCRCVATPLDTIPAPPPTEPELHEAFADEYRGAENTRQRLQISRLAHTTLSSEQHSKYLAAIAPQR